VFRFLKHYVFQLGFLDGSTGLIISCSLAFSVYLKYAALWELECQSAKAKGQSATTELATTNARPLASAQPQRRAA
jgi:hypothetical protein